MEISSFELSFVIALLITYGVLIGLYLYLRKKNKGGNVSLKSRHISPLITSRVEDTPQDMIDHPDSALTYADDEELVIDRRFTYKFGVFLGGGDDNFHINNV